MNIAVITSSVAAGVPQMERVHRFLAALSGSMDAEGCVVQTNIQEEPRGFAKGMNDSLRSLMRKAATGVVGSFSHILCINDDVRPTREAMLELWKHRPTSRAFQRNRARGRCSRNPVVRRSCRRSCG